MSVLGLNFVNLRPISHTENCSKTNLENHRRYSPQKVQKVLRKSNHESIVFLIIPTETSKIKRILQKKIEKIGLQEGNLKK